MAVKAFPSAQGAGADSVGGRGGTPLFVTNLNDSGAGSFRAAVQTPGARTIIFRVSGTIVLASGCRIDDPYITLAFQTSPGGVQIRGPVGESVPGTATGVYFYTGCHNVIARHGRIRIGAPVPNDVGESWLVYGDTSGGDSANRIHDIIMDHMSIEWGADSPWMAYRNVGKVTFQWSIVAKGAQGSVDPFDGWKGPHIRVTSEEEYSEHHNLYATNAQRNPLWQRCPKGEMISSIVYNWSGNNGGNFGSSVINESAIGNIREVLYLSGPDSGVPAIFVENGGSGQDNGGTNLYLENVWGPIHPSGGGDPWDEVGELDNYHNNGGSPGGPGSAPAHFKAGSPYAMSHGHPITLTPVGTLLTAILPTVGACVPSRDSVDQQIIDEVNSLTGTKDSIGNGGPWPDLASGAPSPPTDSDNDGIPDAWAIAHGLDPNGSPGAAYATSGYTHLENYLNELAGDTIDPTDYGGEPPPPPPPPPGSGGGNGINSSNLATGTSAQAAVSITAVTGQTIYIAIHANQPNTVTDANPSTPFTKDLQNDQASLSIAIFRRKRQAGDPSTFFFDLAVSERWTAIAWVVTTPHPTSDYDNVPVGSGSISAVNSASVPSIVTNFANSIHCALLGPDALSNTITSTPVGYIVHQNGGLQTLALVSKIIPTAGTNTGSPTFDWVTATGYGTVSLSIRAAAGTSDIVMLFSETMD